jgi:asparagine synthase (glutamine-hydrolysing)
MKKQLEKLFISAVKKRIPRKAKIGLLFSGGLDSTLIALVLKRLKVKFTCYTVGFFGKDMKTPEDVVFAKQIAKELGFKLKIIKLNLKDVQTTSKKVVKLLNDNSVVHVGVGIALYKACEQAKKDGCQTILSGTGADEVFAGYHSHRIALDVNKECKIRLKGLYEKDLIRDLTIASYHELEAMSPFLDEDLVKFGLKLNSKLKIKDGQQKYILRELAISLGMDNRFAFRKKKAAQYGSKTHKALLRLAKKKKISDYLSQYL